MSASESLPGVSSLHQSIEQLIAETVKQSQTTHEAERQKLTAALSGALSDIEQGQQALSRAAETLRAALGDDEESIAIAPAAEAVDEPANDESAPEAAQPAPVEVSPTPATDRGPHELDVIAHGASIGNASGLQSLLRGRPEVESAQTREFVNGELRLHLALTSGLDTDALGTWLGEHSGELVTSTDSVIEIRFGSQA